MVIDSMLPLFSPAEKIQEPLLSITQFIRCHSDVSVTNSYGTHSNLHGETTVNMSMGAVGALKCVRGAKYRSHLFANNVHKNPPA